MKTTVTTTSRAEWSSLPEASEYAGPGVLTNVRTGRHASFDRIMFEVDGVPSWYLVHYVRNVSTAGNGELVPLRGGAKLEIVLSVPSYDDAGRSRYRPANRGELATVRRYLTFRQVAAAGGSEGQTTFGLGLRAHLPFRVFTRTGRHSTSQVVIDVAHTW
ncbi:hypothetical protein AB0L70_09465 [Kribbella sp. NPDC051952]|uniref:AMIN-like domain-containing (lipo)protein n=1 Tax=Kribbella sp. NPDC051952 TaxID=3154851 RepID=UPI00343D1162